MCCEQAIDFLLAFVGSPGKLKVRSWDVDSGKGPKDQEFNSFTFIIELILAQQNRSKPRFALQTRDNVLYVTRNPFCQLRCFNYRSF